MTTTAPLAQPVTPWDGTTVGAHFRQLERTRPGYTPWCGFVVKDGTAVYTLEPTDRPDLPGTHKIIGQHGAVYGWWTESTGKAVRVQRSGWNGQRGVLGTFDTRDEPNPDNTDPTMRVKGWAVVAA